MYLLYADESGSIGDPTQKFFILAGVCVFERSAHWIEAALNKIVGRFAPENVHSLELHGSPMHKGVKRWRRVPREQRLQAIKDALHEGVVKLHPREVRLFAVVLEKDRFAGQDIAQVAFEQLSSRFDQFLMRLYRDHRDAHRGLMLFDKSSVEKRIQTLAREFKYSGHSFGVLRNFAEVPVFLDSEASRLIQLADLVCYSVYRCYEHGDNELFEVIRHCFDAEGGVQHGLCVRRNVP